jgi:hypothetical protein
MDLRWQGGQGHVSQVSLSSEVLIKTAFIRVELTGGVLAAEALKVVRDWSK